MLNLFVEWAKHIEGVQVPIGIEAKLTESHSSSNPSARLDIDTPTAVARITCWIDGSFQAEVIDLDSEKINFSSQGVFRSELPISKQVTFFLAALGINSVD